MLDVTAVIAQFGVLTESCMIVKTISRFMGWLNLGKMFLHLHSNKENIYFQGLINCSMAFQLVSMAKVSPSVEDFAQAGKVPSCSLWILKRNNLECHQHICVSNAFECIEGMIALQLVMVSFAYLWGQ